MHWEKRRAYPAVSYALIALRELSREAGSETVLLAEKDGVASAIPAKTRSWRSSRQRRTVRRLGEHFVQRVSDCAKSDPDSLPSAQNVTLYAKRHHVHKMFRPAQPARCPHWTSSCAPPPTPLAPADGASANWVARPPGGAPPGPRRRRQRTGLVLTGTAGDVLSTKARTEPRAASVVPRPGLLTCVDIGRTKTGEGRP